MNICVEVEAGRNESGSGSSLNRGQGFEGVEFGPGMLVIVICACKDYICWVNCWCCERIQDLISTIVASKVLIDWLVCSSSTFSGCVGRR